MIYIKLLLTAIFWGGTFIAGKIVAIEVLPFSGAFLRFAIASFFLILITLKNEGRLPKIERSSFVPIIFLGLTGVFAYNVFFFEGLKTVDAGRAALIIALNPVMISLFSFILFKEELNLIKITGILLSVTGALTVISRGQPFQIMDGHLGWGELNILGCVASWVSFSLAGKPVLKKISPLVAISYSAIAGTLLLAAPAFMEGLWSYVPTYSGSAWAGLFFLGFFGTVLGFVWYYEGIKKIGPMKAGLFINVVPLSAVFFAFFFLNEPLTLSLLAGTILVSSGIYLTNSDLGKFKVRIATFFSD